MASNMVACGHCGKDEWHIGYNTTDRYWVVCCRSCFKETGVLKLADLEEQLLMQINQTGTTTRN